ncbi:MAG: hypothetical protein Q4C71_00595 [Microbacteriaceae bacterium]|nr:hypothetical protein [Microbacteriaceae bacterium]
MSNTTATQKAKELSSLTTVTLTMASLSLVVLIVCKFIGYEKAFTYNTIFCAGNAGILATILFYKAVPIRNKNLRPFVITLVLAASITLMYFLLRLIF